MRVLIRRPLRIAYALPFLLLWFNLSAVAQGIGPTSSRPTFDCAKARSPLALLICSSGEDTARADWDLIVASWARHFSLDETDRAKFSRDQDEWLGSVAQKCKLANQRPPFSQEQISCVIRAYKGRAAAYRSKLTGEALTESKLSPEQLAQIQQALIALGFLNSEPDGEFGPATRAAIRKYQEANGFPQSDYLSMQQRRALLEGGKDGPAVAPSNARGESTAAGNPPARQSSTPEGRRAEGEFARLLKIPTDCQTAREFGKSGRWKSQLFFKPPIQVGRPPSELQGPACVAAESCFQTLKSQATAGVEYLTRNPAVSDALSGQLQDAVPHSQSTTSITLKLQQLLATYSGTSWGPFDRCILVWNTVDSHWFRLTESLPARSHPFEDFSTAGNALLQRVRADYAAHESEYRQLLAFNDKYTGLERLERAQANYRQAFMNDDVAAMIRERPAVLEGLEQARARKQLLTQQSAQMAQYEQTLADFVTAIDREGLTSFADQQTQTVMGGLRSELARLSGTAPGKRGDISAKLEIFTTRIRDIDSAIRSARAMKTQAEQTRQMLVESQGKASRVLDAASSEELKGAFNEPFRNSVKELINRLSELASSDLWVIRTRQEDVDAAMRKFEDQQKGVSDAQINYNRLKTLRGTLAENEGAARHVLEAASSEELKGGFDEAFVNWPVPGLDDTRLS